MRWHPKVWLDTLLLLEMSRGAAESVTLGPHSFPQEGKELIIRVLRNTISVYSWEIWRGIKFGGLIYNRKIKD